MNMKRWLMLLPVAVLCPTWAMADTTSHFEIVLDGFDPGQNFTGTGNPDTTPPVLDPCLGTNCESIVIIDPLIRLNAGGGSPGVGTTFTFSTATGSGVFDFQNTSGEAFTSLELSFILSKAEYDAQIASGVVYECDPGNIFATCGFQVVDPPSIDTINVFFSGGLGIPTAVPEPAQWMVLSLAFAGIVIARRKFRANSAYSGN